MLDVLFELSLMPAHLPRHAGAYPELIGELHNAVVGFLAGTPSQLLAINQEDLTKEPAPAEPARHDLAVSELGPQDAVHRGAVTVGPGSAQLHGDVPQLDPEVGARKSIELKVGQASSRPATPRHLR